jgi:outer membrane protein insertion porin family
MVENEGHHEGHHRSARERQRKGPMWGCLRVLAIVIVVVIGLLFLVIGGGYWYVGSSSFAGLIRSRVEETLENRLGREVSIKSVEIVRSRPPKVILRDLRIANSPGAANPYFATVKQITLTGNIDSLWGRKVKIDRVDVVEPHVYFEIYPAGATLVHNFPHWKSGPPSKHEIIHLDLGTLFVTNGGLNFLDRKHKIIADIQNLSSMVNVTLAEDVYAGTATSPLMRVTIQDYAPFDLDLRTGFRYTPNALALQSMALRGRNIEAFLDGAIAPLADGVYDLRLRSNLGLDRVKEIFRVNKTLAGNVTIDANMRGKQGDFTMAGGWVSGGLKADAYELGALRGRMNITGEKAVVDVDSARYGGGTIGAHYVLPTYNEPYPQTVDLRYNGVSLEKLFNDWGIKDTGLRGGATGKLTYRWNKDLVLQGEGSGNATLAKNAEAFSNAKYPMAIAGAADFALNAGTVTFKNAQLDVDNGGDKTRIDFTGSLRIDDAFTDLAMRIHSADFSELDKIGYNFAHSAGKNTYTLLGLGGDGDIDGTVKGKLKTPDVVAHIVATGAKYNDILLGDADIDLRYDGGKSALIFDKAIFCGGQAILPVQHATLPAALAAGTGRIACPTRLAVTGTITFPDRGPSPKFDIAVDAVNYPVDRAIKAVGLKLAINGIGTGRLIVTGTPDSGKTHFVNLIVKQGASELRLSGDVKWLPGKGNIAFNLDIGARSFPVADIATFLDLGKVPATGEVTGTLHLEGPKASLEGAGAVTIRNGSVMGEPVNVASADLVFTKGAVKATNVNVEAPAGKITGSAELNLNTNQFTYEINSSAIDLSKLKLLESLKGLLGGNITLTSRGGGTFEQPELMIEATLNQATISGLSLPPNSAPPKIYLSIHNGLITIKGSVADVLTIEGDGTLAQDYTVDATVKVAITDIAKFVSFFPQTQSLPTAGNVVIEAKLGGKLTSIEALTVDASIPTLQLQVAGHEFTAPQTPHILLQNGVVRFAQFELQHAGGAGFTVTGTASLIGNKALAIAVRGDVEAALLQVAIPGLRAEGHINVAMDVSGTMSDPRLNGTAELEKAQFKFPGFPQLLDNVEGRLTLRGDRIDIEQLRTTVGGGTVVAGGFISTQGLAPKAFRITLQGTDVAIRYFEGLTVDGSFTLLLSGDTERAVLQGDVNVNRALYFKEFDFSQSLLNVLLSRRGVAPVVAASWQDHVDLRLHLTAPGTIAVRNNIAGVTGSADIDVNGTLANPVVLGLVTLDEGGTVRFQNVDYRVVRGTINFQNPFRIDPYFDITLEGRLAGNISEVESGPIDITVNLTGTIDRMTPSITSDPPASDITLFSLLGIGAIGGNSRTGGTGTGPGGLTAGTSLLASSLSGLIGSKILPFADSFTIDPGLLDTTATPGTKVTFQKRISNRIDLLVIYNLSDHQSKEVIEWTVNPEWTIQFTRDEPKKEWRAEGRFRRRFEGHWSWGKHGRNPFDEFTNGVSGAVSGTVSGTVATVQEPSPAPSTSSGPPSPVTGRGELGSPSPAAAGEGGRRPGEGTPVIDVKYQSDGRFDTAVLAQYITVKVGQPLSIRDVRSSIKSLFATGDFRDVRVDEVASGNGVAITFNLSLNYRVGRITLEGLRGRERARADRELTVHQGDVLSLSAVDHSAVAVQEMLNHLGYLEATVDPATDFFRDRNVAEVKMFVTPGPQAKIADVVLQGSTAPFTKEQLVRQMKRGPGKPFRLDDARNDAERMQRYAVRKDYRKATVRYLGDDYDKATHVVTLKYSTTIGPKVRVEVAGVPRGAVRRLIPFSRNQEYSEDAIDRAAEDIVTSYQQKGYYSAAVDTESKLEGDTWITTFHVSPGEGYRLAAVTFTGNQKIKEKELAQVVQTTPQGGFGHLLATLFRRPTAPTRAELSSDRDAIESYYRLQGFSEAKVGSPVVNTKADGTMTVVFPITEGPQTLVSDVTIEGVEQVEPKDLPELLLKPGTPLNPASERQDLVALQTFYGERGNAEVVVAPRVGVTPDKTGAHVVYTIAEGPRIHVGEVVVRGNTYSDSVVVLRKAELDKGEPFSLTKILEAQRNLYRLGIFQRVDVQPEQAGTSVATRNIVIQVQEGKDVTVSGSLGLSKQSTLPLSPRVSASVAHRNLFGTGRYLGLEVVRSRDQREAFITYREPFVFNYNIPVQITAFQTDDQTRAQTHIQQRGTFIEASKIASNRTRWSLRYEYKISNCIVEHADDLCAQAKEALIPGLDRSLLDIKISSVTPTFFWDRRDDQIDPHRGFFTSASVEYAFRAFRADANFIKEFAQGAWYLPLSQRSVFVLSGRAGLIQPFGKPPADEPLLNLVPLSERFTAGGDTSQRAFPLDLLGTTCKDPRDPLGCEPTLALVGKNRDVVAPIGGNGLLLFNAEYRFPIVGAVNGAVFTDIGNVYRRSITFGNLRYGVGTGIRYVSPVGPIRFDIGYNLYRRVLRFDADGNAVRERPLAYFLTIGFPF